MRRIVASTLIALVLPYAHCGTAVPANPHPPVVTNRTAVPPPTPHTRRAGPAKRAAVERWLRAYFLAKWFDAVYDNWLAAHPPPAPVSSMRCPPGRVKYLIESIFGPAAPWAESIAWRESNCLEDPPHNNVSRGIFQFQGHTDLLELACPDLHPALAVLDADCAVRAAKLLYDREGIRPWRL